jgi:hypothetical protein
MIIHVHIPQWLVRWIIARSRRTPYFDLGDYMQRHWLFKVREWAWLERWPRLGYLFRCSARVHKLFRSDREAHLHDHPWPSISVVLEGEGIEVTPKHPESLGRAQPGLYNEECSIRPMRPGTIIFRSASARHKILIPEGGSMTTLFIMGPWQQDWGFFIPNIGKVYWRRYLDEWNTK